MTKQRLDQLLVQRGFVPSRQKAKALIMSGDVLVSDVPVDKPGTMVESTSPIRIRGGVSRFVSRGGDKLDAALSYFEIALQGVVALDVGSSTGGFTDCLLQRGANRVYAVDVGSNQLCFKLRQDEKVVVMEKTHAINLKPQQFIPRPSFAVMDLSFIGLRKVMQSVVSVLEKPYQLVVLVKPQFELGPEYVSKGGVVREESFQREAVRLVAEHGKSLGLTVKGDYPSPLRGEKKGNQEYFLYFAGRYNSLTES